MKKTLLVSLVFILATSAFAVLQRPIGQLFSGATSTGESVAVLVGTDGTVYVSSTLTGTSDVEGTGTAGVPAGGVLTIQGVTSGFPLPITGGSTPLLVYGASISNAAASTITSTVQTVLAVPGVLTSVQCDNADATTQNWVQLHDTTGAVTVGTTVPGYSVPLAAAAPGGITDLNWLFSNGLKVAATTGAANSTTASTAIPWCNFGYRALVNGQ